ncbi:MAG: segregation/condensation protein A [Leptospiraceae bacterium]|nr:segregation/condensation protein A [Leptospiraceae bacterium]MDW8305455.1 segregation/condensation protein A [Leptospiraceae bacterium]
MVASATSFEVVFTTRRGESKSGPLAVLWKLIESYEVDIFSVSLSRITEDFLHYMMTKPIPLEEESDFAIMATRLIYYKSKMLLPTAVFEAKEEPQDILPLELVEQLLEYKRYQQAAELLRELEAKTNLSLKRPPVWELYEQEISYLHVDLLSFLKAFRQFLERREQKEILEVVEEEVSVEDMILFLREKLARESVLSFFETCLTLSFVRALLLFLALLELVRLGEIKVYQKEPFHDIEISAYGRGE